MTALTPVERHKLNDLEGIIEKGLQTFVEVGASLALIREQKLHRETHETFEAYVEARWGWTASRARQLIGAAEAVRSIESVTTVTPTNEAQARELAPVPAEHRAEVWQEAVASRGSRRPRVRLLRLASPCAFLNWLALSCRSSLEGTAAEGSNMQANASNGNDGPYLTVEGLAAVLKVSERQVRYWLADTDIPHRRPSPRVVLFVLAEVDGWMKSRTPEPTKAAV